MSSQRSVKRRKPNPCASTPVPHPKQHTTTNKMDCTIPLPRCNTPSLPFESHCPAPNPPRPALEPPRPSLPTPCPSFQTPAAGLEIPCSALQSSCTADSSCSGSQCCEPLSAQSHPCSKTQGVCCDSAAVPCMDEHCQKLIEEYCSQCLDHDPCPVENCTFDHCDECCDNTCTEQCSTQVPIPLSLHP
jgi:hypothetical protein